jgi:Na+-driven multidrug efflux pump
MCYFLIPLWGIYGAAIATDISMVAMSAMVLMIFKRSSGMSLREFLPKRDDVKGVLKLFRNS